MRNGRRFREALHSGKPLIGAWLTIPDPAMAEMLALTGVDFLLVDQEHAPISTADLQNILIGFRGTECASLVRVPWNEPWMAKHVIDVGADAVMFPMVMNREEAAKAVASTKYPPAGIRGVGPRRAAEYGLDERYFDHANDDIGVVVQIEHIDAVNRTEEIATTPGVDAIYVGPADLTGSLGRLPEFGSAETKAAIDRVAETCLRVKVPFGIYTASPQAAADWINRGGQLQTIGEDNQMLLDACVAGLAAARGEVRG